MGLVARDASARCGEHSNSKRAQGVGSAKRRARLGNVIERYEFILIDCPPTLGLLTLNALVAANGVIIPVQTQYYALKGVAALLKIIKTVQTRLNPKLT